MPNHAPLYDDVHEWLTQAVRQTGAEAGCFHLRSRTGDRIICQAITDGLKATHMAYGLDLTGCPAVVEVLSTGQSLAVDNAATDLRVAQVARERFGLKSVLYQPIRIGDSYEAVTIFSHRRPHQWSSAEVVACQQQAAVIESRLEHVRLDTPKDYSQHARMLSALPGVVSLVDRDLLTHLASAVIRQSGDLASQGSAISIDELIRDSDRGHEFRAALLDCISGDLDQFQAMMDSAHGTWWVHVRALAPTSGDGDTLAVVHVHPMPEASSALLVQEERTRLEALGRIAGSVAHEVNNALQHINFSLEEMDDGTGGEQRAAIGAAAERASRMTSQLLTFARRAPSQFERVDLADFVSSELGLARRSVGRGHFVNIRLRGHAPVRIDVKQMELVLINLCRNAAEASPEGTEVTVECGVERRGAQEFGVLAVIDRGSGLPSTVIKSLGELQVSTKAEGVGAGIGLAVVKQVADAHGGEVVAERVEGGGTRVAVYLPLYSDEPKATEDAKQAGAPRVLIIDDEVKLTRVIARRLSSDGFKTECCSSLASALAVFDQDPQWPSLVVLDQKLGDGNGLEFFEHARAVRPDLRFIAVSGFAERESILAFSRAGCQVLIKPFKMEDLRVAVQRALA